MGTISLAFQSSSMNFVLLRSCHVEPIGWKSLSPGVVNDPQKAPGTVNNNGSRACLGTKKRSFVCGYEVQRVWNEMLGLDLRMSSGNLLRKESSG
jgi:hypothetical protein